MRLVTVGLMISLAAGCSNGSIEVEQGSPTPAVAPSASPTAPTTPSASPAPATPPSPTPSAPERTKDEYTGKPNPVINSDLSAKLRGQLPDSAIANLEGFVVTSLSNSNLLSGQWYEDKNFQQFASYFEDYLSSELYLELSNLDSQSAYDNRIVQSISPVFIDNGNTRVPSYCEAGVELSCVNSDVNISFVSISEVPPAVPPVPSQEAESEALPPAPTQFIVTIAGDMKRVLYDSDNQTFELSANYTYEFLVSTLDGKIHYINNSYNIVSGE